MCETMYEISSKDERARQIHYENENRNEYKYEYENKNENDGAPHLVFTENLVGFPTLVRHIFILRMRRSLQFFIDFIIDFSPAVVRLTFLHRSYFD